MSLDATFGGTGHPAVPAYNKRVAHLLERLHIGYWHMMGLQSQHFPNDENLASSEMFFI